MRIDIQIETERLILRKPVFEDADEIFSKYAVDSEVTKYLVWAPHKQKEETVTFINRCLNCWNEKSAYTFTILLKESCEIIGMIEVRPAPPKAEVGYVSARQYWGKGYMTESLNALINAVLSNEDIFRVYAYCHTENYSSRRVLEKSGMHLEGILKKYAVFPFFGSYPRDCCCYAITK